MVQMDVIHVDVLKYLSQALKKTKEAYMVLDNRMNMQKLYFALMRTSVLVISMKGEDVFVMNVGNNRAALQDVQRIKSKHPYLPCSIMNDRVKRSLKVTTAFGMEFYDLLEMQQGNRRRYHDDV
uniref:Uncharacterized protein n=1 Tax=Solanum lycopersicum TaxID=4081 RepID=K4BHF3_SOLLC